MTVRGSIRATQRLAIVALSACGGGYPSVPLDAQGDADPSDVVLDTASDAGPNPFGYTFVKASDTDWHDQFGYSVALSSDGTTLAVGANWEESGAPGINGSQLDNTAHRSGAVYLFRRSGTTWVQQAYIKASNPGAYDEFGTSVALSGDGNTLAVGAPFEDSATRGIGGNQSDESSTDSGAVYVFRFASGSWTQHAYLKSAHPSGTVGQGDNFGHRVRLSTMGDTLAVSALAEDNNAAGINDTPTATSLGDSGAAYIFVWTSNTWSQQAYLKAAHPDAGDVCGADIALAGDGSTLVVGCFSEASASAGIDGDQTDDSRPGTGAAFVFTRTSGTWTQSAYLKASNPSGGDNFGGGVAISSDATTIAVGAIGESSSATGINGNQTNDDRLGSGAVYLFVRSNQSWQQQAYVKGMHPVMGDHSGRPLSLSANGDELVVASRHGLGRNIDPPDPMGLVGVSGAVDWYSRTQGAWSSRHYLKAPFPDEEDFFGHDLVISADGETAVIGAYGESSYSSGLGGDHNNNLAPMSGAVFVLE